MIYTFAADRRRWLKERFDGDVDVDDDDDEECG